MEDVACCNSEDTTLGANIVIIGISEKEFRNLYKIHFYFLFKKNENDIRNEMYTS
jgi:hypothetical protein